MESVKITVYEIDPVAKPDDKIRPLEEKDQRPQNIGRLKIKVRQLGIKYNNGYSITFVIPMPKSWSKKKKRKQKASPAKA